MRSRPPLGEVLGLFPDGVQVDAVRYGGSLLVPNIRDHDPVAVATGAKLRLLNDESRRLGREATCGGCERKRPGHARYLRGQSAVHTGQWSLARAGRGGTVRRLSGLR